VGCTSAFAVPGDYNLVLLDNMLLNKELQVR
jgi:TPP-dependent 2-oxoacid decarboxylase